MCYGRTSTSSTPVKAVRVPVLSKEALHHYKYLPVNAETTLSCSESSLSARSFSSSIDDTETTPEPTVKSCLKVKTQAVSLEKGTTKNVSDNEDNKSVGFSTLEIRLFPLVLGDNPSVSCGPPLTIAWDYEGSPFVFDVEQYEDASVGQRRLSDSLKIPSMLREDWLRDEGYSRGEMNEAKSLVRKAKDQRVKSEKESAYLEQAKEAVKHKFKKWILHVPSDKKLYQDWREQGQHQLRNRIQTFTVE